MKPNSKKSIVYAKVLDRKVLMVEVFIHPVCSLGNQPATENKDNKYKWFTEEHFRRLISKLQDVILARVLAPSETKGKKKGKNDRMSQCDCAETLPDHELLIQYQFVRKRMCGQIVLVQKKEESQAGDPKVARDVQQSDYSGGGYESCVFYPEKLHVTVMLNSQPGDQKPAAKSQVTEDVQEQQPPKSTISKYFNKENVYATRSTLKKRAASKCLNKKNDSQGKSESYVCSNLPVGVNSEETEKENSKVFDSAKVQDVETDGRNEDISCVNQFSPKIETHDVVPLHESENGSKQDEYDQKILKRRGNEDNEQGWSQNEISADSVSVTKEDVPQVASCSDGFNSLKDVTNVEAVKDTQKNKSESIVSNSSKLKRRRSFSESDTTNSDTVPCLRSRISKNKTVKKQRAVSSDESGGKRKAIALVDRTEDDNDFETPKVRRNTAKRKGSDLSDDQDLFTSAFSTDDETSSNVKPDAKGTINSKKRRTNQVEIKGKALSGKAANLARKRVTTRQAKTVNGTAVTDLEDVTEEPESSPARAIAVEDKPVKLNIRNVEELTASQTEQLVREYTRELRDIFEGKIYCRRHEDYKKGGKMKGDLAFQVQFGSFSEEQRDRIMGVLTNMFCYKHSKYFDYVSKVLLPETLVMVYMRVERKTRLEAERLLLEGPTSSK